MPGCGASTNHHVASHIPAYQLPGPIQLNTAPRMAIGQAPAILSGRAVIIELESEVIKPPNGKVDKAALPEIREELEDAR